MRKSIIFLSVVVSATVFLTSCQKETSKNSSDKEIVTKINSWLDAQKSVIQPQKGTNIELLKENLDFSRLRFEQFAKGDQFLIIPVKEKFSRIKNIDKNYIPNLVLVMNQSGKIKRGNIVLYLPETRETIDKVPDNTFYKMFNDKAIDCNGRFLFLSVTGKWVNQSEYKKGRLYSFGSIQPKSIATVSNNGAARINTCIDWYIVTTYYVNGIQVWQTSEYIGTTCYGCDDPNLLSLCPDNGSDGGSDNSTYDCCISDPNIQLSSSSISETISDNCGLENIDPATGLPTKTCIHSWYFCSSTLVGFSWKYKSSEEAKLEKEGGVWKFKTVSHSSTGIDGTTPPCTDFNLSVTTTPSISADKSVAQMFLSYTISFHINCLPTGTKTVSSNASTTWNAPQ